MKLSRILIPVLIALYPAITLAEGFAGVPFQSKTEELPKDYNLVEVFDGPETAQTYCYSPKADRVQVFGVVTDHIRFCFAMNRMYLGEVAIKSTKDFEKLLKFMQTEYGRATKIKGVPEIRRNLWVWGDQDRFLASLEWDKRRGAGFLTVRDIEGEAQIGELALQVKPKRR